MRRAWRTRLKLVFMAIKKRLTRLKPAKTPLSNGVLPPILRRFLNGLPKGDSKHGFQTYGSKEERRVRAGGRNHHGEPVRLAHPEGGCRHAGGAGGGL